jgi:hypothetical protein
MGILKIVLFLILLSLSFAVSSQGMVDTSLVFNSKDYLDSVYQVFPQNYKFKSFRISLINLHPISQGDCSGFVLITRARDTIYHRCFLNMESLGGCSGIYSSDSNQFKDYFFISKFGDYNGRLLILNAFGKIIDIPGSSFYFSKDHTFVFADQDSDIGGLTVWDLKMNKLLYDSEKKFEKGDFTVGERFLKEIRYDKSFHYLVYLKDPEDEKETQLFTLKFNNQSGLITQEMIDKKYLQSLPTLTNNNSPSYENQRVSCFCGKPGQH